MIVSRETLTRLRKRTCSPEPSLTTYVVSTIRLFTKYPGTSSYGAPRKLMFGFDWKQNKKSIYLSLHGSVSDFFTNLFLGVPGLTRPKFFASQTRSSASHMGPTLNHKFYVSIQIRPIHTSQFEKQDTVILTYTIKSKLTLSCKIIFRAQAISLCSSNSDTCSMPTSVLLEVTEPLDIR